jgi:hypothetical protein
MVKVSISDETKMNNIKTIKTTEVQKKKISHMHSAFQCFGLIFNKNWFFYTTVKKVMVYKDKFTILCEIVFFDFKGNS